MLNIDSFKFWVSGIDLSQALRPLVNSFSSGKGHEYSYEENIEKLFSSASDLANESVANELIILSGFSENIIKYIFIHNGSEVLSTEQTEVPKDLAEYRYAAGRVLYDFLSDATGITLPWGVLVGIRPTKHVVEALEAGVSDEAISDRFVDELYVSTDRVETSLEIAHREMTILDSFDYKNGYSLYIGIPFCPTTCLYCSFTSYPLASYGKYMNAYLDSLEKEMQFAKDCMGDKHLDTIYVGGGTPTALTEECLERLLQMIHKYFPVEDTLEFSVEAGRPDSLTPKKLELLKQYKVNRISINPQTLVARTLKLIGRHHTVESVYEAFKMAREAGHDNINLDMIIGLTGESPEDVAFTLQGIEELNPESLTVHTLAIKRAARLNVESDKYKDLQATRVSEALELTKTYAKSHEYHPYYLYRQKNMAENLENIGYAKDGKYCIYNILIMEEKQTILALGAGASTKLVFPDGRIERSENVKSLTDYIDRIDEMIERKRNFLDGSK